MKKVKKVSKTPSKTKKLVTKNSKSKLKAKKKREEEVFIFDLFGDHFLTFIPEPGIKKAKKTAKSGRSNKLSKKKVSKAKTALKKR